LTNKDGVVIAHDYVTQRGGAERVALTLTSIYPDSRLVTALYNGETTFPEFKNVDIRPSVLNRVKALRRNPQFALPLLHYAWAMRSRVSDRAVVVSSSGWAHAVRVSPRTTKVVYCHNPPRWIYQSDDYLMGRSLAVRLLLSAMRPILRRWDKRAAATADIYVANSTSVAARIKQVYEIDAQVIHPPVSIDASAEQNRPTGVPDFFFLTVGRGRGYKGTSDIVAAFERMPNENLVVVGGDADSPSGNISGVRDVSDGELRWLYARATALISISKEDFGLTPIEANTFGTPALLVRAGGFLDSLDEGKSGLFLSSASVEGIIESVESFPRTWDSDAIRLHAARFSLDEFSRQLREIVDRAVQKHGLRVNVEEAC